MLVLPGIWSVCTEKQPGQRAARVSPERFPVRRLSPGASPVSVLGSGSGRATSQNDARAEMVNQQLRRGIFPADGPQTRRHGYERVSQIAKRSPRPTLGGAEGQSGGRAIYPANMT